MDFSKDFLEGIYVKRNNPHKICNSEAIAQLLQEVNTRNTVSTQSASH